MALTNSEIDQLRSLLFRNQNSHKKRVTNAAPSVNDGDYVTQGQLKEMGIEIGFDESRTITAATIRTSKTNPKIQLDSIKLESIDASGAVVFRVTTTVAQVGVIGIISLLAAGPLVITGTSGQASSLLLESRSTTGAGLRNTIALSDDATPKISFGVGDNLKATMDTTVFNLLMALQISGTTIIKSTGKVVGDDTAYNASSWDANDEVATKNAIRDILETIIASVTAKVTDVGSDGPKTVPLAKITGGGTDGSITYNSQGIVTASVDPT